MKRKVVSVFLLVSIMLSITLPVQAQDPVKVTVDGMLLEFDVPPTIIEGRTLVPLRAIFEALGVDVGWNGETRTVIGKKDDIKIELPIGNKLARKNGKEIELDVPAKIIDGRTLVPARFIAESIGAKIDWDGSTRTVTIRSNKDLLVHFIDVGQGDATFIDYGDYEILIDAGDNSAGDIVVNYLNSLNVDDIEIMIATHPDADHIGGLDDVLNAFDVERIIDSGVLHTTKTFENYLNAVRLEEVDGAEFIYDDDMTFELDDNITFEIIETGDDNGDKNSNSVVSKLIYNDVEVLFTGDMESEVEHLILDKDIEADILKVGHHGSNTSSSREFLDKVNPKIAVISAGEDNRYGHPHSETLIALEDYVDAIYGTWQSGNIVITIDGVSYEVNATETVVVDEQPQTDDEVNDENTSHDPTTNKSIIIQSIDLSEEIVTIYNDSDEDIDMTGWKLVSVTGNQTYEFPSGYILKSKTTVQIVSGRGSSGDGVTKLKWTGSYIWNNDGDPGILYDNVGNNIYSYPN